jgi:hypothetical protein
MARDSRGGAARPKAVRQRSRSAGRSSWASAASSRSTSAAAPAVMASALSVCRRSDSGTRRRFGAAAFREDSRLFGAASARLAWYGQPAKLATQCRDLASGAGFQQPDQAIPLGGAPRGTTAGSGAVPGRSGLTWAGFRRHSSPPCVAAGVSAGLAPRRARTGPGLAADGGRRFPPPRPLAMLWCPPKSSCYLAGWPMALTPGFAHQAPALFSQRGVEGLFSLFPIAVRPFRTSPNFVGIAPSQELEFP